MEKDIHTFAEEQNLNLTRVTDVSSGVCPLGPSKKVKAAIRKAAKDIGLPADRDCRRLAAFFASKFGIQKDCILFANSGSEIVYRCRQAFKPSKVIVAPPAIASKGAAPEGKPGRGTADGSARPEAVPDQLCSGDLLIVSNPDRITGSMAGRAKLRTILHAAAARGAVVVLDESLIQFTGDDSFIEEAGTSDNLIILRTTANFYGLPGLELAYAVSSPQTLAKLRNVCRPGLNHLAIEAARTALKDKTYIKAAKAFIREERRLFLYALRKISGLTVFASDSNVFLAKVDSRREEILSRLSRAGFLVRDCGDIDGLDNTYLRLSVMSHDKNSKFIRILKEITDKP